MLSASYRGRRRHATRQQKIFAAGMTGAAMTAGLVGLATPANAASESTWEQLAQCESGGDWSTNTGNGFYGGLQFTNSTWDAFGGEEYAPRADQASKAEQIAVAERVLAGQGWGAWPACSDELGLSGGGGDANAVAASSGGSSDSAESSDSESNSSDSDSSESSSSSSDSGKSERRIDIQQGYDGTCDESDLIWDSCDPEDLGEGASASSGGSGDSYTVESGDTLGEIAAQHGTSVEKLFEANDDVISDPAEIYPGQELSV